RVAAPGHAGTEEPLDVALEDRAVVVDEVVPALIAVRKRPGEERRHLTTGHEMIRAEQVVTRWVAPSGDTPRRQPLDVVFEDTGVVAEGVVGSDRLHGRSPRLTRRVWFPWRGRRLFWTGWITGPWLRLARGRLSGALRLDDPREGVLVAQRRFAVVDDTHRDRIGRADRGRARDLAADPPGRRVVS